MKVDPMSSAIGSIFLEKSIFAPAKNPVALRIGRNTKNFNFSGVLPLHDLLDGFQVSLIIHAPSPPITSDSYKEALAFPSEECCARNIEAVAYLFGFVLFRNLACGHGTLSR
jgi:hypothetical protein